MFKSFIKKHLYTLFAGIIVASTIAVPLVGASEPRDEDSNAIIWGGAYSIDELERKVANGTGHQYQSGAQLTNLFETIGMNPKYFNDSNMKNGYVYRNGNVTVNGRVVKSDVLSMGRHRTPNSVDVANISYPAYWRPPSDSFAVGTTSIPAFVYINYDGSMAFAVIKSCGNPVKGVGVRVEKHDLTVKKFEDKNGNKIKDTGESYLANWQFRVNGPNSYSKTFTTNSSGEFKVNDLPVGKYSVEEIQKSGWTNTTPLKQEVTLDKDRTLVFGNKFIVYSLEIKKFNDSNGDKQRQTNEPFLPNWEFRVKGTNFDKTFKTGANGNVVIPSLTPGSYTITEINKAGWSSTTGLTKTITLSANQTVLFGNKVIPVQPQDTFTIVAKKYEDINGNKVKDDNEPWLKDWHIKISGNNVDKEFLTDAEGTVRFTGLPAGTYTVTEVMQNGWKNTTLISQSVKIPDQVTLEGYVEFGNQRIVTPVTPKGEVIQESAPTALPTSGPAEAVMGTIGGISLAGAGIYYKKGKKLLLAAYKSIK